MRGCNQITAGAQGYTQDYGVNSPWLHANTTRWLFTSGASNGTLVSTSFQVLTMRPERPSFASVVQHVNRAPLPDLAHGAHPLSTQTSLEWAPWSGRTALALPKGSATGSPLSTRPELAPKKVIEAFRATLLRQPIDVAPAGSDQPQHITVQDVMAGRPKLMGADPLDLPQLILDSGAFTSGKLHPTLQQDLQLAQAPERAARRVGLDLVEQALQGKRTSLATSVAALLKNKGFKSYSQMRLTLAATPPNQESALRNASNQIAKHERRAITDLRNQMYRWFETADINNPEVNRMAQWLAQVDVALRTTYLRRAAIEENLALVAAVESLPQGQRLDHLKRYVAEHIDKKNNALPKYSALMHAPTLAYVRDLLPDDSARAALDALLLPQSDAPTP